jgi:hypothetical protein
MVKIIKRKKAKYERQKAKDEGHREKPVVDMSGHRENRERLRKNICYALSW